MSASGGQSLRFSSVQGAPLRRLWGGGGGPGRRGAGAPGRAAFCSYFNA
ncbi:MAG: hypothetical protein QOJ25_3015, partial [Solirubrobacteraceae bacterium]|nr:hypothetical protein [Solirubrobacteraceae bacterium]